jgi:large subunit ribosomal protein L7/L12
MDESTNVAATETVEVPAKFQKIVSEIEGMSVLDLNELVKVFEKKFGVSAAAVAAPAAAGSSGAATEEKSTFTVELTDGGAQKIAVIKVVKEALNLGLKDAKDKVDGAPAVLVADMKKEDAEALKKAIEDAGGKVVLK